MLDIQYKKPSELLTYRNNAKIHSAEQVEQIKRSIEEFGFNDPVAIWKNNEIIEGHGRLIAALELGIEQVPVIVLDELTDEQRRAYAIIHNKLTTDTGFDEIALRSELESISGYDMSGYGFDAIGDELALDVWDVAPQGGTAVTCEHCGGQFRVTGGKVVL